MNNRSCVVNRDVPYRRDTAILNIDDPCVRMSNTSERMIPPPADTCLNSLAETGQ